MLLFPVLSVLFLKRTPRTLAAASRYTSLVKGRSRSTSSRRRRKWKSTRRVGSDEQRRNCAVARRRAWNMNGAGSAVSGMENFTRQFHLPTSRDVVRVEVPFAQPTRLQHCPLSGACSNCVDCEQVQRKTVVKSRTADSGLDVTDYGHWK